jgi:putative ABC transport system permease protein
MRSLLNWLSQIVSVTRFGLQTLPERKGASTVAIVGIAGVVIVMVGVLSIAHGIVRMMAQSATPENVIVMRSGSTSEMMSGLGGDQAKVIAEAPGIIQGADGPLASSELFVIINLPKRTTGTDANVPLRGVVPAAFKTRDRFEIVEGRLFEQGLNELIVGVGALREFEGLEIGRSIEVGGEDWPIVGTFAAGGGITESEIWADARVIQGAYRRGNSYQAVYAKLESTSAFGEFKDALTTDPRISVKAQPESEYHLSQSQVMVTMIQTLGVLITALMGLGAVFGAINTMYNAVSSRTREIATLRALGFKSSPVVISVLFESLLLAFVGGSIGGILAYLAFDGFRAATLNFQSFAQITFAFQVSPALMAQGVFFALMMGLVGGLFPAIRAARIPVAIALREL